MSYVYQALVDLFTRVRLHPRCRSPEKQPNKASTPMGLVVLALADSFFDLDQGIVSEKLTQGKFLIQPALSPRKLAVGRSYALRKSHSLMLCHTTGLDFFCPAM